ncbi:MAG: archease [Ignavibacterium sp.]
MSYKIIEHTADIGIYAEANSIDNLFKEFATGFKELTYEINPNFYNINNIDNNQFQMRNINLSSNTYEELLVNFLDVLNYNLLTKQLLFYFIEKLNIYEIDNFKSLNATIKFIKYNRDIHQLKNEIKAVTFHQLEIKKKNDKYFTTIIFDI